MNSVVLTARESVDEARPPYRKRKPHRDLVTIDALQSITKRFATRYGRRALEYECNTNCPFVEISYAMQHSKQTATFFRYYSDTYVTALKLHASIISIVIPNSFNHWFS